MLHVTFMGGAEIELPELDNIVITVWGGTEIKMPTLAEKIVRLHRMKLEKGSASDVVRRTNVITLMGGTAFKHPTVAREIEEMCRLRDSGLISDSQLRDLWHDVIRTGTVDIFETFTMMGGAASEMPGRKEELKALDHLALKGILSASEAADLRRIIQGEDFIEHRDLQIQQKLRLLLLPPGAEDPVMLPSWRAPAHKLNTLE
jgi:hypothetical protein